MRYLLVFITLFCFSTSAIARENSMSTGEKASDFTLPNAHGKKINLSESLKNGHVVLTFYRGGWCPICNRQLHELQEYLPKIKELGAQLIAISPETPDNAQLTMVKNELNFEVLSDKSNKLAKQYGILWEVPHEMQGKYGSWIKESTGKTLEEFNDQKGYEMPIPATFVIKSDGTVIFAFVDEDYKNRAKPEDIIEALKGSR